MNPRGPKAHRISTPTRVGLAIRRHTWLGDPGVRWELDVRCVNNCVMGNLLFFSGVFSDPPGVVLSMLFSGFENVVFRLVGTFLRVWGRCGVLSIVV